MQTRLSGELPDRAAQRYIVMRVASSSLQTRPAAALPQVLRRHSTTEPWIAAGQHDFQRGFLGQAEQIPDCHCRQRKGRSVVISRYVGCDRGARDAG
jgi:hypothetical protein